jgi:anti-sigma factor RsiW
MSRACRVERYLTAYVDDELSPRLRRKIERHVKRCGSCAGELDSIRSFGRILESVPAAPTVTVEKWEGFEKRLSLEMDGVDRSARRAIRVPEARPVFGDFRRRALAFAGAGVAAAIGLVAFWPTGIAPIGVSSANGCIVESLETYATGYTPMAFTSDDPEMTVIWVFSEEVEGGGRGEAPGSL